MTRTRLQGSLLLLLLGSLAAACSPVLSASARDVADANDTGNAIGAKNASERTVLQRLPGLPSGKAERLGSLNVTAEAPYTAASGRTCRALSLSDEPRQQAVPRLACTKGGAWFFVPDVFAGGPVAE
jgi:hypothetical protein